MHQCVVDFSRFFEQPALRAALFVGGVDASSQLKALREGVDIVTGTPGRLVDLAQSGKLRLSEVRHSNLVDVLVWGGEGMARSEAGGREFEQEQPSVCFANLNQIEHRRRQ